MAEGASFDGADYRHFVQMARGSAYELEAQIIIASDIGYIDETLAQTLVERINEICRMLNGLIRFINRASP